MDVIHYEPWGYDDNVTFIKKNSCGCDGGRSKEQQEIDEKQDKEIKQEIERSQTVDAEQSQKIDDLTSKIDNLDKEHYYETDE